MIRPDVAVRLAPWREVVAAVATLLFSIWVFSLGGWLFWPIGAVLSLVSLVWLVAAWQRRRFRRAIAAPGVIEVDEGVIRYFGARILGGQIALRDLSEIRLLNINNRAHWRLKSASGEALLVPLDAAGADALADAFTSLPGLDMGRVSAAVARTGPAVRTLWVRQKG